MSVFLRRFALAAALPAAALLSVTATSAAAQESQEHGGAGHEMGGHGMMQHEGGHMMGCPGHEQMQGMMQHEGGHMMGCQGGGHMQGMMQHETQSGHAAGSTGSAQPAKTALSGEAAFGAIQEIVRQLDADPKTDWSKVNLEALRQHFIDMSEVTLKADAVPKEIEGGVQIAVTGRGRTLDAIERMVAAHAAEIEKTHLNGWSAKTEQLPNGLLLTVTATDPKQVQHIRGLGFIGIMVSGEHHQAHHLAMARGEMAH
ncbi:MAG TPA: hypothetical protein VFG05_11690 [Methylocella sp.]|nr:hypothetical protein [Methylocella sp.]